MNRIYGRGPKVLLSSYIEDHFKFETSSRSFKVRITNIHFVIYSFLPSLPSFLLFFLWLPFFLSSFSLYFLVLVASFLPSFLCFLFLHSFFFLSELLPSFLPFFRSFFKPWLHSFLPWLYSLASFFSYFLSSFLPILLSLPSLPSFLPCLSSFLPFLSFVPSFLHCYPSFLTSLPPNISQLIRALFFQVLPISSLTGTTDAVSIDPSKLKKFLNPN